MNKNVYFLAANSFEGFVSDFKNNYNASKGYNVYIIKGGPGTGKSSFMKYIGRIAEKRGYSVTLCPCSSDPDSLDGIIIPSIKTVILDGTAPHVVEPEYPGVCEEIINLGHFWNSEYLKEKRFEIINITNINKALHKTAARYLSACKELAKENLFIAQKYAKKDKILKFSENLCKNNIKLKNNGYGTEHIRYIEGITPKGIITFSKTVTDNFGNIAVLEDRFGGVSGLITEYVRKYALACGYGIITLKNPYLPSVLTDHILIPELDFALVTERDNLKFRTESRRIHARRFTDIQGLNNHKNRIIFNEKVKKELLNSAVSTLKKAKISHDALEKYYVESMDFGKATDFAESFAEKILR